MVLGKNAILDHIHKGSLRIDPFQKENLREASYIFTLSPNILLVNSTDSFSEKIIPETGWVLQPGSFIIGYTTEHLYLDSNVCAVFDTRRMYARLGIDALQTDTFAEPGTNGSIELSMRNGGPVPLPLFHGMPLVKAYFQTVL